MSKAIAWLLGIVLLAGCSVPGRGGAQQAAPVGEEIRWYEAGQCMNCAPLFVEEAADAE